MKWQTVALMLVGILAAGGVITYSDLFGALFNLTGVNATYSGDIHCENDCESYINVTTSYWRICFAGYNDTKYENETLFKKVSRSRTLHINLDNVDNIISTEPDIPVEWLVPTYGYNWRPIKDGDCWERKKVNRIKLVGHKEVWETVKWGFGIGEYIDIDPVWIGDEKKKPIEQKEEVNYTYTTETHCINGTCWKSLYSGTMFGYEDQTWKPRKELRSFINSTNIKCIVTEDGNLKAKCLDYNDTTIKVRFEPTITQISKEAKIPIIVYKPTYNETIDKIDLKEKSKVVYDFSLSNKLEYTLDAEYGDIIHFGEESTTIILQDNETENLEDCYIYDSGGDTNYGLLVNLILLDSTDTIDMESLIKFNISSIPNPVTINNAILNLYSYSNNLDDSSEGYNFSAHHLYNQTWNETYPTWNNFAGFGSHNLSFESEFLFYGGVSKPIGWITWNVTNMVESSYVNNNGNVSIYLKRNGMLGTPSNSDYVNFYSKESVTTATRPYLNITYLSNPPTFSDNSTNSTLAGTSIEHRLKWENDVGLSGYIFSFYNGSNTSTCIGTLDCSQYSTESTCKNCSQCNWTSFDAYFFETFESNYGDWDYDDGDAGCDWLRDQDGTPSSSTGPQPQGSAPGAAGTDYYVFVESSSGQCDSGEQAYLTLDTIIDLDTYPNTNLSFYYSMYGAHMGTLNVQLNTSGTWSTIWTISGDQGADPVWTEKVLNFSDYSGSLALRFEYDRNIASYYGDIALDHINVSQGAGTGCSAIDDGSCSDCAINECDTNCSTGGCSIQSTEFVNDTAVSFSGILNWSNVSKTITSDVGKTIKWCVYANNINGNWNTTSCDTPFSYVTTSAAVGDTCDCSSIQAGTIVDCSESCTITACDASGQNIYIQGEGAILITGNITNHGNVTIIGDGPSNKCNVTCLGGCFQTI